MSQRLRWVAALLIAVVVVAAGVWWRRAPASGTTLTEAGPTASGRAGTADERVATVENSLRALEEAERAAPRDRWDPEYVATSVGHDPTLLFTWVRDNTSWIPYRGVLRGPSGVLMDRQGSALDRAMLLATLLEKSGHTVRLAHSELTREQGLALLPRLTAAAANRTVPPVPVPAAELAKVATEYGLDGAAVGRTLEAQRRAVSGTYAELNTRVADQVDRLLRAVPARPAESDWSERFERAVAAARDHWWVQRQEGDSWVDLDLVAPEPSVAPLVPTGLTSAVTDLPSEYRHELAIRLVVERWGSGALSEHTVLDHVVRPADYVGQTLVLQIWPGEWPQEVNQDPQARFGLKDLALQQTRWGVVLMAGNAALAQAELGEEGEALATPGNPFAGLGTGIAGIARPAGSSSGPKPELTAAWIEYEIRAPGEAPRVSRRPVFDALGPARRMAGAPRQLVFDETQRLARSLALMVRAEIMPLTSRLAPEFLAHLSARSLLANRDLLNLAARSGPDGPPSTDAVLDVSGATVSPLVSMAFARLNWNPAADRIYVDRLGLATRHWHMGVTDGGLTIRGATDVVAGETGVALSYPDAFAVRLAQGVIDSNAEALWWTGETPLNAGEAWKVSKVWTTLTPADTGRVAALRLPEDSRAGIEQDLAKGLVVVAPSDPVAIGSAHYAGWWRVDPTTGATTGVSGSARGDCAPEYSVTLRAVVLRAARQFAYETVLCHGMAQAFNEFKGAMADLQRAGYIAWWAPQIAGAADAGQVAKDAAGVCLIGAIAQGMLSTSALVPFLVRGAEESEALIAAAQSRQTLASLDNFAQRSRNVKGFPRPAARTGPAGVQGPGGTLAEGVAPKTIIDEPIPVTERGINTGLSSRAAQEQLQGAAAASDAAQTEYYKAVNDFVQNRAGRPMPAGGWAADEFDAALQREVNLKDRIWTERIHQLRQAQAEARAAASRAAAVRAGPNMYQIAAGQAGVAAADFWQIPWK